MSEEALAEAKKQKEAGSATVEDHQQMSAEEHAAMTEAEKSAEHEHGH